MASTLTMRKMWVIPVGTSSNSQNVSTPLLWSFRCVLTVPVVAEVEELVSPLCDDAESIFQEGDDDEEAAHGRKVPGLRVSSTQSIGIGVAGARVGYSRLYGLADAVEDIFNLARVRPDLVEEVAALLLGTGGSIGCRAAAEAVARRTALHGCGVRCVFGRVYPSIPGPARRCVCCR